MQEKTRTKIFGNIIEGGEQTRHFCITLTDNIDYLLIDN